MLCAEESTQSSRAVCSSTVRPAISLSAALAKFHWSTSRFQCPQLHCGKSFAIESAMLAMSGDDHSAVAIGFHERGGWRLHERVGISGSFKRIDAKSGQDVHDGCIVFITMHGVDATAGLVVGGWWWWGLKRLQLKLKGSAEWMFVLLVQHEGSWVSHPSSGSRTFFDDMIRYVC